MNMFPAILALVITPAFICCLREVCQFIIEDRYHERSRSLTPPCTSITREVCVTGVCHFHNDKNKEPRSFFLPLSKMPRYAKSAKRFTRTKRTSARRRRYNRSAYRTLSRRISTVSRKLAAETCKFESTPDMYSNVLINGVPYPASGTTQFYYIAGTQQTPLTSITSGTPWVMPLNWIYQGNGFAQTTSSITYNGVNTNPITQDPTGLVLSTRNPLWYNTYGADTMTTPASEASVEGMRSPGFQYRLKYLYIRGLFNASVNQSENNSDGAVRIVIDVNGVC